MIVVMRGVPVPCTMSAYLYFAWYNMMEILSCWLHMTVLMARMMGLR